MDSIELSDFLKNTRTWPLNKNELSVITNQIAALLKIPFVALSVREPLELIDWKARTPFEGIARFELLKGFLKPILSQHQSTPGNGDAFLSLEIPSDFRPWTTEATKSYIHLSEIRVQTRTDLAKEEGSETSVLGWIAIGSDQRLTREEESRLVCVSLRLSLLATTWKLESLLAQRTQFLSVASHELKTPLTSIYGVLQLEERMLKSSDPLLNAEKQKTYVRVMIRQVQRLNELIDGLLDVSRIQNGRFLVEPTETDVVTLIKETLDTRLMPIAQDAGVSIHFNGPEELVAWIDPVRMEELISNVVMNAIRFSPEGGVVWVRLNNENSAFRLTVRDQGPSVPLEDRERIFRPFERTQRTSRLGGMGLGLYISRQIALLHGGNVSLVESVPGKGNVFEAYLPCLREKVISLASA
ncbi:HAMP domain-containing sensor histidine kinase [Bdellovibrionota bacterium FG-2]